MPSTSKPSLHPEFTPFSVSVSCAKLSITQKLLLGVGCGSSFGCRVPWDRLHLTAKKSDNCLLLKGPLKIPSMMRGTGRKNSDFGGTSDSCQSDACCWEKKKSSCAGRRGLWQYPAQYWGKKKSCMILCLASGNTQNEA